MIEKVGAKTDNCFNFNIHVKRTVTIISVNFLISITTAVMLL